MIPTMYPSKKVVYKNPCSSLINIHKNAINIFNRNCAAIISPPSMFCTRVTRFRPRVARSHMDRAVNFLVKLHLYTYPDWPVHLPHRPHNLQWLLPLHQERWSPLQGWQMEKSTFSASLFHHRRS